MVAAVTARIASTPKTPTHAVVARPTSAVKPLNITSKVPQRTPKTPKTKTKTKTPTHVVVARPTSAVKPLNITSKVLPPAT